MVRFDNVRPGLRGNALHFALGLSYGTYGSLEKSKYVPLKHV